jgi:hypothetical protein
LHNALTLHYKYPNKNFVAFFVADAEPTQLDVENLDFSQRRLSVCSKVTKNVTYKAEHVKTKALEKSPSASFKLGNVVLVHLDDANHTKVDGPNLVGVIVSINMAKFTCQVVVKNV